MALSNTDALFLSNDELLAGLLEDEPRRLQYLESFPFHYVAGDALRIARSSSATFGGLPQADAGNILVTDTEQAVPANVSFPLTGLVQDVTVADLHERSFSNVNDQLDIQVTAALQRMLYKFSDLFIKGTGAAGQFNGLRNLVVAGQSITSTEASNALSLKQLDLLLAKIKGNYGRAHCLIANRTAWTLIRRAYYAAGLEPDYTDMDVPDKRYGMRKRLCLSFDGVPVVLIEDEFQPNDEPVGAGGDGTSVWAAVLGPTGLHGIIPRSAGPKYMKVRKVVEGMSTTRFRVYWPVGLALETTTTLARLQFRTGIAPVAP